MKMLHNLAPQTDHIIIQAADDTKVKQNKFPFQTFLKILLLHTGGLPTTLIIAKRAKVMLTVNVDVSDDGARGIIASVIKTDKRIIAVLVEFADVNIGLAAIQKSNIIPKSSSHVSTRSQF